jgi:molybdopterin-biosynthesis enzyme MoeA-like protein
MQGMLEGAKIHLSRGKPVRSESIDVFMPESFIAEKLSDLQDRFKDVEIGSYPFVKEGKYGTSLVIRSSNYLKLSDCKAQMELMISKLV